LFVCCVQDEWAVCKVFNKELAARTEPIMAAAGAGELERVGSLGFLSELLDSAELPALIGADVDEVIDFNGPASTSGAPGTSHSHLPVKMEEHALLHMQYQQPQPPPPPPTSYYSSQYFSLPAMNSGDVLPPAIRRYCKAEQQVVSGQTAASAVSPSRETGLSADPNAEISSAVTPSSHQFLPEFDDPVLNLADLWKY
jgi:hypothetical protein